MKIEVGMAIMMLRRLSGEWCFEFVVFSVLIYEILFFVPVLVWIL